MRQRSNRSMPWVVLLITLLGVLFLTVPAGAVLADDSHPFDFQQSTTEPAAQALVCEEFYYGVQHCVDAEFGAHFVLVDLGDPHVRVQTVLSSGPSGECNSVNSSTRDSSSNCPAPYPFETVTHMLERYRSEPAPDGREAVAIINTDYFGTDGDHGAQGLAVRNGVRLDGPAHNDDDGGQYLGSTQPSLAFSPSNAAAIGKPGSEQVINDNLSTTYYNVVAGAPIIVEGGQPVNDSCTYPYPGDTCSRLYQSAAGLTSSGQLVLASAQQPSPQLSRYLIDSFAVQSALKFDGGGSAHIAWVDGDGQIQDYHPDPDTEPRPVAEGLLIFSHKVVPTSDVDVSLIIDSSGSMGNNDPQGLRREVAKVFVSVMSDNDQVAVVDFDSSTRVAWPLGLVGGNREVINQAIDTVNSSGGTNIGAGLQAGYDQLTSSTVANAKAAVLLTDGIGSYGNQAQLYAGQGWPVHTIGLSSNADADLLQRIASETGGSYYQLTAANQLVSIYYKIALKLLQGETIAEYAEQLVTGQLWQILQEVVPNLETIYFLITWPGSEVTTTLTTPSGSTIEPATTVPGVLYSKGQTYELYRIDGPEPGSWTINVYGTDLSEEGENVGVEVSVVTGEAEALTVDAEGPYQVDEGGGVTLEASVRGADSDALTYEWDLDADGVFEAAGQTAAFSAVSRDGPASQPVQVRVCKDESTCATDDTVVEIHNVAPAAEAGAAQTVYRGDVVTVEGSWQDPAVSLDDPYGWTWDLDGDNAPDSDGTVAYGDSIVETVTFASEGLYTLSFSVTDKDGGAGSDTVTIEVLNRPPDCSATYPTIKTLWPVSHEFVSIEVLGVTDPEGDAITMTIDSIYQDEPVDSTGDGAFTPDGRGVGTSTAEVRAERAGKGNGRFYHIRYTADDGHGGSCSGEVLVSVPMSQGKSEAAIDDGALYDSTIE